MVKNFNKNSSKNPENSSSTNWDISPEERQEIAQYREQTINSAESGDIDMLNGAVYSGDRRNILDNIRTKNELQAKAYVDALEKAKGESIHDKINSEETTADRLNKKRKLEKDISSNIDKSRDNERAEEQFRETVKKDLWNEWRNQEYQRKRNHEDSPNDTDFWGIKEWESQAKQERETNDSILKQLEYDFKNPKLLTKLTNLIPFVRKKRTEEFERESAALKIQTPAERKLWNIDEDGKISNTEWHDKQIRIERTPNDEDIQEAFLRRQEEEYFKPRQKAEAKHMFERNLGISEALAEKGIKSEIINNPAFIKQIEKIVQGEEFDGKTVMERLKQVEVYNAGRVKFESMNLSDLHDVGLGTSSVSLFEFRANEGRVSVDEFKFEVTASESKKVPSLRDMVGIASKTETKYNSNGDIDSIEFSQRPSIVLDGVAKMDVRVDNYYYEDRIYRMCDDSIRGAKIPGMKGEDEFEYTKLVNEGYGGVSITRRKGRDISAQKDGFVSLPTDGWKSKISLDNPLISNAIKRLDKEQ